MKYKDSVKYKMNFKNTNDLNVIVREIDKEKRFILNNNVYLQFISIFNEKIFSTLHKKLGLSYTIYILSIETLKLYCSIDEHNLEKLKNIVNTSDIDYTFQLPKISKFLPSYIEESNINICITKNKNLTDIIYKITEPLIGFNANIKNDIYYTNHEDIINEYIDTDIFEYSCGNNNNKGFENSILSFDNDDNNIIIIHKGYYDKILQNVNISDRFNSDMFKLDFIQIYLVDIIDINLDEISQENKNMILNQFKSKYLSNCAFIDFNQKMLNYKHLFSAYVDSSSDGNFEEAIFNFYSIIHQIMKTGINTILINNPDHNVKNNDIFKNILLNKYNHISSSLVLPYDIFIY